MDEFLQIMNEGSNVKGLRSTNLFCRLRAGCLGCAISMLLLLALLVCLLAFAFSQLFAKPALSAEPASTRVILVAAEVPPARNDSQARGEFLKRQIVVEYQGGEVFLSSSGEALAALATDDWVELSILHADGTGAQWRNDFRNLARTQIVSLPAKDITGLFRHGRNVVTLTLKDLTPFTYWSAPYYLILQEPTPTPAQTVAPTVAPVLPAKASLPTQFPSPFPTETLVPTPAASPTFGAAVGEAEKGSAVDPLMVSVAVLGATGVLLLGVLSLLVRARRRSFTAPILTGWLDLFDTTTHESQPAIDLSHYPEGLVLMVDPLRVEGRDGQRKYIAALVPSMEGATLLPADPTNSSPAPRVLNDADHVTLAHRVELEYHNPFAHENDFDQFEV